VCHIFFTTFSRFLRLQKVKKEGPKNLPSLNYTTSGLAGIVLNTVTAWRELLKNSVKIAKCSAQADIREHEPFAWLWNTRGK
jgi:hypothetical protein